MPVFKSMELLDEEMADMVTPFDIPMAHRPQFPYGLRISLSHVELDKLGVTTEGLEKGDVLELTVLARVTDDPMTTIRGDDVECRLELQIEQIANDVENETVEHEQEEEKTSSMKRSPLYR